MAEHPWRIGIWAAVSSKAQAADDKVSLDEQERLGREFAASVGGEVVAVYSIPGHSRDLWRWDEAEQKIAAYRLLREDIEAQRIDVLWALDIDRLGRKAALQQQVLSLVEEDGDGEVYLASNPHMLGQKGIGQRYIESMQGVRTVEEQRERKRRHHMGMKSRVKKRGLLPGAPPFYLDPIREPTTGATIAYEFNDQVAALDLMTDLFLKGYSYEEIRRRLNKSPYPTPGKSPHWRRNAVRDTLLSNVPAGIPSWSGYSADEPSDKIPARWGTDTLSAVIKERRRREVGYHQRGSGPLFNVALCNRCGYRMGRQVSKYTGAYYLRCAHHADRGRACHSNHIREAAVLDEVAKFLRWLADEEVLDQVLAEQGDSAEVEQLQRSLARAQAAIDDLERRQLRVAHAYAAGDMEIAVYRQVAGDLDEQLKAERGSVQELTRLLEAAPDLEERRATLVQLSNNFPQLLKTKPPTEIATMLHGAGVRVYVENKRVQRVCIV